MSSGPVEIRMFIPRATLRDIENGANIARLPIGPFVNGMQPHAIFLQPPLLQFRYKEKTYLNGAPSVQWSDWILVPVVREGDEPAAEEIEIPTPVAQA